MWKNVCSRALPVVSEPAPTSVRASWKIRAAVFSEGGRSELKTPWRTEASLGLFVEEVISRAWAWLC